MINEALLFIKYMMYVFHFIPAFDKYPQDLNIYTCKCKCISFGLVFTFNIVPGCAELALDVGCYDFTAEIQS